MGHWFWVIKSVWIGWKREDGTGHICCAVDIEFWWHDVLFMLRHHPSLPVSAFYSPGKLMLDAFFSLI